MRLALRRQGKRPKNPRHDGPYERVDAVRVHGLKSLMKRLAGALRLFKVKGRLGR
jgi:hypothetical protein